MQINKIKIIFFLYCYKKDVTLTLFTEKQMLLFTIKHLQSHAFLQTYNAILPTSLISLRFSTRGYSPWRPAAVISTIVSEKTNTNSFFMILLFILIHPVRDKHKIIRKGRLFFRKGSSCAKWLTFRGDPTSFKKKRQLFSNEQQYSRAYLLSPVLYLCNSVTTINKDTFPKTVSEY